MNVERCSDSGIVSLSSTLPAPFINESISTTASSLSLGVATLGISCLSSRYWRAIAIRQALLGRDQVVGVLGVVAEVDLDPADAAA